MTLHLRLKRNHYGSCKCQSLTNVTVSPAADSFFLFLFFLVRLENHMDLIKSTALSILWHKTVWVHYFYGCFEVSLWAPNLLIFRVLFAMHFCLSIISSCLSAWGLTMNTCIDLKLRKCSNWPCYCVAFTLITVRNVVTARLCFHSRLSFCSQGVVYPSRHWADTSWADTPLARNPMEAHPPGSTHP